MDVSKGLWDRRLNGTIEIRRLDRSAWNKTAADHLIEEKAIYTWRPPYQIACRLPDKFALSLECSLGADGLRRFRPLVGFKGLVFQASVVGHAILVDRGRLMSAENLGQCKALMSIHAARLFNQYSRFTRAYLGETIKLGRVLGISRAGRPDSGTRDILPLDLGLSADGAGLRWNAARLKDEGRRAAKAAGNLTATEDEIVCLGLLERARMDPLSATPSQAKALIRLCLFDAPTGRKKRSTSVVRYVAEQVRASMYDHLDDPRDEFDEKWIKDPKANLVHRISKRSDCHWDKEEIRAAMQELGWLSFEMLAESVKEAMGAFAAAMPAKLNRREQTMFADMFVGSPGFGGIPLILLHERFDFLKPALVEIWGNADDRSRRIGTALRMMYYYSYLVSNRHAADRHHKHSAAQRNENNRPMIEQPLSIERGDVADRTTDATDPFREICIRLALKRGFPVSWDEERWEFRVASENKKAIAVEAFCPSRGLLETITISRKDFERIAREIRDE